MSPTARAVALLSPIKVQHGLSISIIISKHHNTLFLLFIIRGTGIVCTTGGVIRLITVKLSHDCTERRSFARAHVFLKHEVRVYNYVVTFREELNSKLFWERTWVMSECI